MGRVYFPRLHKKWVQEGRGSLIVGCNALLRKCDSEGWIPKVEGWIVLGEREMVLKLLLPTLHSFAPHCKIKWSICIFRGWKSSTYFRFQEIGVKCSSVVEQMKLEDFLLPFETWFGSWWTCPEGEQLLELWTSAAWLLQSIYFQSKNNHDFRTAFHS